MAHDIIFRGLSAPLRVENADDVTRLLPRVVPGLPFEMHEAAPERTPFFTISSTSKPHVFRSENLVNPDKKPRRLNAVNALCDMIAALGTALPLEDDSLICLHAAGVVLGDTLVLFPNIRRAGKSTLSAALAHQGVEVFSDDVIPVFFDAAGQAFGRAMGAAPRIRLPLPETVAPDFRDWADSNPGPANRQYKYLDLPNQPQQGRALPLGAFVILDRQDDEVPPRLENVTPDAAMDVLLHQNFTRDRHSADVLSAIARTLQSRPAHRLVYSEPVEAAAFLVTTLGKGAAPDIPPKNPIQKFRLAEFSAVTPPPPAARAEITRRADTSAAVIGSTLYLSDAEGRAIHRMDPLAMVIWDIIEEPIARADLEAVLIEAFPETDPSRVASDLATLLSRLETAALITRSDPPA